MESGSPFWDYSIRTYSIPGVAPACLELQNSYGVDVNILLFVMWCASEGRQVSASDVAEITAFIGPWAKRVVLNLRTVRQILKEAGLPVDEAGRERLRNKVKACELDAERLQQECLYARFPLDRFAQGNDRGKTTLGNLAVYSGNLGVVFPGPLVDILAATQR